MVLVLHAPSVPAPPPLRGTRAASRVGLLLVHSWCFCSDLVWEWNSSDFLCHWCLLHSVSSAPVLWLSGSPALRFSSSPVLRSGRNTCTAGAAAYHHVPSLMLRPLPHAASPPSCHVCSLVLRPFSHATSSPPPALHQPPFPWPIPAASTSRPLRTVSDASVIVDAPPLHTVLCTRCAPTPFSALTSPYACVCACSCAIVHLLLYMY